MREIERTKTERYAERVTKNVLLVVFACSADDTNNVVVVVSSF